MFQRTKRIERSVLTPAAEKMLAGKTITVASAEAAGKAAVDHDDIRLLINHAHDDQWREVVVMAAGHASADQCA